jgi:integrase
VPVAVEVERGLFHVRKGKTPAARRTLNLTAESRLILARRITGLSRWLFPSPRRPAGPLQPGRIEYIDRHIARLNNAHDDVCAETGLTFVLYDFRHTFATRMAEAGCDLATLAAILGHSSLRQVFKYVHPTAEHQRAAMLKYESLAAENDETRGN